ncbi:MAG TPA: DEAD/DEAH box helicase, partial [Burkholderiales bacterium]|nr:DEAD/DEAH box helicase [Burkholderiales bacterium]
TLRPFQAAGVRYMLAVKRGFIADEMGLGKTIQALAWLEGAGAYPAVIVCPASLKLNWLREARTWLPRRKIIVCDSRTRPAEIEYADVCIVNYDVLRVREEKQEGNKKPLLVPEGLLALLIERCPRGVVFDEFHYCKNPRARRTKAAALLAQGAEYRLGLTGTPILNRPNELIAPLKILGRLRDLGGYAGFIRDYCGGVRTRQVRGRTIKDTSGATNLERLNEKLRATCYVRRLKKDVLSELPPKVRGMVELEIDNRDEYNRARADVVAWLGNRAAQEAEFLRSIAHLSPERQAALKRERRMSAEDRAARAEHLVRIEALKQLAARGKLRSSLDWVRNFLESGEKLVLFATHKDIVRALAEPWQAPVITGETPVPERQAAVDRFQHDPDCRLIVLNLRAGGVGLTLTAASNVAFHELGWTPADHDQAEDRCHRIGQRDSVTAYYLLADRTIDIDIWQLIEQKRQVVDQATDGQHTKSILHDLTQRLLRSA